MTDGTYSDRVVVVTGAGSGIGRATCIAFAKLGAKVAAADINKDSCGQTVDLLKEYGHKGLQIEVDVAEPTSCREAVEEVWNRFGRIDVLFNNAGITVRDDVLGTTEEQWDRVLAVNLKSVFLMSKYVIPYMKKRGGGVIVNTASGWGINGGGKAASYCASKGGVVLLTKAMAIDHGPDNIRVNCVCPGDTHTAMLEDEAKQLGLGQRQLVDDGVNRPLGRVGKPEDIANAVTFLASAQASFITGTPLVVDGGGLAGSA